MARHWQATLSAVFLVLLNHALVFASPSFENTAIVRTIELGGSLVHVTTTYAVKALEEASIYTIALGEDEQKKTSWLEAKIKGQAGALPLEPVGYNPDSGVYLYAVELTKALKTSASTNIVVETVQTHAAYAYPEEAAQKDGQSVKYEANLFVLSPYETAIQRTKLRSPSPVIHSYTIPEDLSEYTLEDTVTKSGATITYGPYKSIPPSADRDFISKRKRISVHYDYESPILEVKHLHRSAEISHWGANLNIEDNIHLHNAGPSLKGHFSRLEHQTQNFFNKGAPHVLPSLTLHLPAGISNVYYYDLIGNVSTSHLRTAPSVPKGSHSSQYSILEMRPRYPVMGGWNYSFTLGWDSPLRDSAGYDKQSGKWIVGIPVMTLIPGAVVDEAEVKIILPEGAFDIDFHPPFGTDFTEFSTHISYLDTVGHPAITVRYKNLTDRHVGTIYVSYKVPFSTHLKKPFAVATAFFGLFILGFIGKRIDIRIQKQK